MNRSLPVRLAASLDAYFENRFQQNLRNGVLNLLAFIALLAVGIGHLVSGWTRFGIFLLILSAISVVTGVWDIWIYRRNLPPTAKRSPLDDANANVIRQPEQTPRSIGSITERTTRHLHIKPKE